MFTRLSDFEAAFDSETGISQKIFDSLTDQSLSQEVCDGHRTLGRMAWHIITTYPEMMGRTGLKVETVNPEAPVPSTADEIKQAYSNTVKSLKKQIMNNWTDASLEVEDDLYGEQWKKGATLAVLIRHEVHHRGQMSILMRQAGIRVPSIYGPAKEDWSTYDMPIPEV